jgi:hypothetical protein
MVRDRQRVGAHLGLELVDLSLVAEVFLNGDILWATFVRKLGRCFVDFWLS